MKNLKAGYQDAVKTTVHIDPRLHYALRRYSFQVGQSVSMLVNEALSLMLEKGYWKLLSDEEVFRQKEITGRGRA
jgi:hypothetical protein